MDELRIALDSVRDKLKDLFSRVNQLEAAPTVTSGSGGGAPVDAQYLVLAFNAILTNERRLDFSARFATVDGGAGGDYDVDLAASGVADAVYGSATQSPQITVDVYGRITNAANVAITGVPPLAHPLLGNTYHNDVVNQGPTRGSLIYGNATPLWDELVLGGITGSVLTRNATDVLWSAGALAFSGAFTLTIPATGTAALGTGAANRTAYWTGTNTLSSDAGLTVDAANNAYLVADAGGVGNSFATAFLGFNSSGATDYAYFSGCYVGINDLTPSFVLDVNGIIGINGTQTVYNAQSYSGFNGTLYFGNGGGSLLHTGGSEAYYNTGIGIGALNSNTTGSANSALGSNSLNANTTGSGNTGIGRQCLTMNTIGYYNTAFGIDSSWSNVSGYENCSVGVQSLYGNTSNQNVAIGAYSLRDNGAGSVNTAIGLNSGRWITGGIVNNETGTNSVFVGAETKAAANGQTNQIVIGYGATGNGSNTATIGTSSITDFYGFGNHIIENQHFVGITGDVRTVWDSTNGHIIEQLDDNAGADEWRVVDSGSVAVGTFDSDGNLYAAGTLGVGVSAPSSKMHIRSSTGTVPALALTDLLVQDNSAAAGQGGVTILGGTAGYSIINFADDNDENAGHIIYDHTNDYLQLRAGGAGTAITINSGNLVGIGVIPATAQCHIDQSSSTAAVPVLKLDQADVSEEAVYIIGTSNAASADQTLVKPSDFPTPGALLAWVKCVVSDTRAGGIGTVDGWIPVYAIPT